MPTKGNLFGDLLAIGEGKVELVDERLEEFRNYADTVPGADTGHAEPETEGDSPLELQT